jgi:hypothetical protein
MHKLSFIIGFMGLCVVTQAALRPVRLIYKSIDRSERFRSRWVAAGLIAGLMALALGSSAALAKSRNCYSEFLGAANVCGIDYDCAVNAQAMYYQCLGREAEDAAPGGAGSGGSKTKTGPGGAGSGGSKSGPRGPRHVGPVNASMPNPGVLNPNVGGTSGSTNAAPSGSANRPPAAQPTTGSGNATTTPGATAGLSTGAILSPTGPGQGVGSLLGGTVSPRGIGSATGGTYGRQSR